jgi:hypothetical protein
MSGTSGPTETAERLEALAGVPCPQFDQHVREWMCPCLADRTCRWPKCAKIGNGIDRTLPMSDKTQADTAVTVWPTR